MHARKIGMDWYLYGIVTWVLASSPGLIFRVDLGTRLAVCKNEYMYMCVARCS